MKHYNLLRTLNILAMFVCGANIIVNPALWSVLLILLGLSWLGLDKLEGLV